MALRTLGKFDFSGNNCAISVILDTTRHMCFAALVDMALRWLFSIDHSLIQFLRDCVVSYLEDETPAIRKEAALTCSQLLLRKHFALSAEGIEPHQVRH